MADHPTASAITIIRQFMTVLDDRPADVRRMSGFCRKYDQHFHFDICRPMLKSSDPVNIVRIGYQGHLAMHGHRALAVRTPRVSRLIITPNVKRMSSFILNVIYIKY